MGRRDDLLRLKATGSERWLACTPSAGLEEGFTIAVNMYDEEKVLAQYLADEKLRWYLGRSKGLGDANEKAKMEYASGCDEEIKGYAGLFLDHAIEAINRVRAISRDVNIFVGEELDFSP